MSTLHLFSLNHSARGVSDVPGILLPVYPVVLREKAHQVMSVRTRMKELRARDGLRQADLARKVGVRRETISFVENGEYNPSLLLAPLRVFKTFSCDQYDNWSCQKTWFKKRLSIPQT